MILLTKDFTKQIECVLRPFLIQHGFSRVSTSRYRRYIKPFIHCIWIQERSDGAAVCVNLGVHLDFIPGVGSSTILPVEKVQEVDCEIRTRLAPGSQADCWWPAEPPEKQVASIKSLMEHEGLAFFERYNSFPGVFESIRVGDIDSTEGWRILPGLPIGRIALLLARVHDHIGHQEEAVEFAEYGLKNIGRGVLLKPIFEDIIQRNRQSMSEG